MSLWRRDRPQGPQVIQVGESPWYFCEKHNKYYDKKSGEEVKVVTKSLEEILKECQLPCCKNETLRK